jgi:cell division septation protein DedD
MAGDGYYPEYYLRKRKRDRTYSIITRVVAMLVVGGGSAILAVFLLFQYVIIPKRSKAGVTSEMAVDRQELSTEQKLAAAALEHEPAPVPTEQKAIELSSLPYSDSMPGTAVTIQGLPAWSVDGVVSGSESDPIADKRASSVSGDIVGVPGEPSDSSTTPEKLIPAEPVGKPEKNQDEAKPAKKPESKQAETKKIEKKAEAPEKKEPTPAPAKPETTVYRVYAGSAADKAAADELKSKLGGLGYGGTIIKSGPEYLVLVETLEDFDKARALSGELQGRGFSSFTTRSKAKR